MRLYSIAPSPPTYSFLLMDGVKDGGGGQWQENHLGMCFKNSQVLALTWFSLPGVTPNLVPEKYV